jgi:hypothetical protein
LVPCVLINAYLPRIQISSRFGIHIRIRKIKLLEKKLLHLLICATIYLGRVLLVNVLRRLYFFHILPVFYPKIRFLIIHNATDIEKIMEEYVRNPAFSNTPKHFVV